MGTKNNPGQYDCYASAHPDEPIFVLLGRDRFAASLVQIWAAARESICPDDPKAAEALRCATDMAAWCDRLDKTRLDVLPLLPFDMLAEELRRRGATVTPVSGMDAVNG